MSKNQDNTLRNISTILKISSAVVDLFAEQNEKPIKKKDQTCSFFSKGKCKYGENCRFKHS